MGKVTATVERELNASVDKVRALIADYREIRPQVLPEQYREYEVIQGGSGAGTEVKWKLQATSKRVRDVVATITEPTPGVIVEADANSSMVTTWTVREGSVAGTTSVRVETTWNGAGGVGGFFEKTFAPLGLKRIYNETLTNFAALV